MRAMIASRVYDGWQPAGSLIELQQRLPVGAWAHPRGLAKPDIVAKARTEVAVQNRPQILAILRPLQNLACQHGIKVIRVTASKGATVKALRLCM